MKKGHKRLQFKRHLIIIGTSIIALISTILIFTICMADIINKETSELQSAAEAVQKQYNTTLMRDSYYTNSMYEISSNYASYIAYYISKNGYNPTTANELYDEIGEKFDILYFSGKVDDNTQTCDGNIYSGYSYLFAQNIPLDKSELYQLFTDEYFCVDDSEYIARKIDSSTYIIMNWVNSDIILHHDTLASFPSDYAINLLRVDSETGTINDANNLSLIDTPISSLIDASELANLTNHECSIIKLTNKHYAFAYLCSEAQGADIYAYIPLKSLTAIYIRNASIPLVLTVVFLFMIMVYMLRFMKPHSASEKAEIQYFHFFKNIYSDQKLLSHNQALGLIALIAVIFSTMYLQTLIHYSSQNIHADSNLDALEAFIKTSEINLDVEENDFATIQTEFSDTLADYYLKHPNEINNIGLMDMRRNLPYVVDISLYDKTGTVEYTTNTNEGYTLSFDPESPEYICRMVLNGEISSGHYEQGALYYAVSRRQDSTGLLMISLTYDNLTNFRDSSTIEEAIQAVDFQTSEKGYIIKDSPDTIYWMSPNTSIFYTTPNTLSAEDLTNSTIISKIQNDRYVINIRETDNYYLLSALNSRVINGLYNLYVILIVASAFILQQILIFILNLRAKGETPENQISISDQSISESIDAHLMDTSFKVMFKNIIISCIVAIIVLLIFDSFWDDTSLTSYMFEASWPKGFNLFSFTMIIITVASGTFISSALRFLIVLFTKNMGARGLTIGKMLCSVIRFVALLIIVVLILLYLGVNYTALLAGAGITGIAVTVCAQSSISDMFSGFLIVFENLFNIGDWITVDDFRGQVTEIGLRTTKLQISNTVKILNNSQLKDVTVMERNGQGCIVNVDIAYKEDANKVIELLRNSTERYQSDIPAIKEGPYIDGIINLGASGVTLYIWAIADLELIRATEREIRRVTKNILDENHIEIPFTQITIHEADN